MLSYDAEKLIPVCPQCSKELKELEVRLTAIKFYEYDHVTRGYNLTARERVDDDNLFHCSECGAGIEMKEIFETLNHIAMSSKKLVPA
jgi:predicted nucleic acid-binding Zn ribbon protein